MGNISLRNGNHIAAESRYKRALAIREKSLGPDHLGVADILNNLAEFYRDMGNYSEAKPLFERALAIKEKSLGPDHLDVAISLSMFAKLYHDMGNYGEAKSLYKRALAIREKAMGLDHPDLATIINNLAMCYEDIGNYEEIESLYKRALAIREKALGSDHPDLATIINNLAELYETIGDYFAAEPLVRRVLAIRAKTMGYDHPDVADVMIRLAWLYQIMGNYSDTEPLYKSALTIRENTFGSDHPGVTDIMIKLAGLYKDMGNYEEAAMLYKRSLAIREKSLEINHHDIGSSFNGLAGLYQSIGNYEEAESLYNRALAIIENSMESNYPALTTCLNDLAGLHIDTGNYGKAELLLKRALTINEKMLDSNHPALGITLNNLALFYGNIGNYSKAALFYERALAINEKSTGADSTVVATILNNLAVLYMDIADYEEAESLYKRSLAIREKSMGADHPDVASSLSNLAVIYLATGKYSEAETLFQRALAIKEKTLGSDHVHVAICLECLGGFYLSTGNYSEAEPLYKRALAISEKTFGPEHPVVAIHIATLAMLYCIIGNYSEAEPLYKRALAIREKMIEHDDQIAGTILYLLSMLYISQNNFEEAIALLNREQKIREKLIDQVISFTSEQQKLRFLCFNQIRLATFLSVVVFCLHEDISALRNALGFWLRCKGIVLESQRRFQEALIFGSDPEIMKVFEQLSRTRTEISRLYFTGAETDVLDNIKEKIINLEKQRNKHDARLTQLCRPYAEKQKIRQKTTVSSVAQNLPPCTVLLEFIRLPKIVIPLYKDHEKPVNHDVVFMIFPDENIQIVDLGLSDIIDSAVNTLKKEISTGNANTKNLLTISRNLHNLVFAGIKEKLGVTRELFISPDGNLSLIPFEVLQDENGRFLIEDYTFNYLSSGRDILGFGQVFEKSNKALIVGDPDFENDIVSSKEDDKTQRSVELELKVFSPLPGTRKEIEDIANIVGHENAVVYSGKQATEEALTSFHNPALLHLATHGFFKADQPNEIDLQPFMMRDFTFVTPGQMKTPGKKNVMDNPLFRSGLVLAGANRAIRGESKSDEGILTADKILNLRLWGTKLVVLSACETGMGDVRSGEGVFGLRRTFNQVGAKSIVMSMWKVPDKETQELMVNFYRNIYEKHMDYNNALRQATLTQLQTVKTRYGHANPYYWGAFVFSGDPNR
jgi:tetratricopeptide (TPR) repeat protein/CHAT domain-containing protein